VTDARFTIIIPSYNGGNYLKQCVSSVLTQTYEYYTLAVLDDGSTDGSLEWLQTLQEPRLTLYPALRHLGIVGNWQRVLSIPKAEFMTILGQDDLLDPNYLAVMGRLIQAHPKAGLYHSHFRFINSSGIITRPCRPLPERETAAEYLAALFTGQRDTYGTGYVMRSERYAAVGGIPPFEKLLHADDALWMALMAGSYKATAPEECFACRLHSQSASGGTEWRSWLLALPLYAESLCTQAETDSEFAAALQNYGPAHFAFWQRQLYILALTRATRRNERVESEAVPAIANLAAQMPPCLALSPGTGFAQGRAMTARKLINRYTATRTAYCAYVRHRYGSQ
jgi:hypothetical protein